MRKKDVVICITYAEHSLTFYTDKNLHQAALQKFSQSDLSFNSQNSYDTLIIILEATSTEIKFQNILLNKNTQNIVSDIFSTYDFSMLSSSVSSQSHRSHVTENNIRINNQLRKLNLKHTYSVCRICIRK